MQNIYLDYNATTPLDPEVVAAMQPVLSGIFGNPSSAHSFGFDARKSVETARELVAELLQCRCDEIVFTSGGTESNNHAIIGIARAHSDKGKHIITSVIEHPATLEVCKHLQREGFNITYIPVDSGGCVNVEELEKSIRKDTILISVMHANNEIGTIQPIELISQIAKRYEIIFHTDAAQSAGKIPVNVGSLGVDLLSLAAHKMYGPKGIGAIYIRDGIRIEKLIHGANHELNRRAGTENVLLITGFGKACELAKRDLEKNMAHMQNTRDTLYKNISSAIPSVHRNGDPHNCLPNTLSISFPGVDSNLLLSGLTGLAASAGAACHAEHTEISHVLQAIGLNKELALGSIRLSTGRGTSKEEISDASAEIIKIARSLMLNQETGISPAESKEIRLTSFTQGLGCACKMRPQDLETVLKKMPLPDHPDILVDSRNSDDGAVWRIDAETAWVQSVDFFTPVVDDPFSFGAIAAANALSDLYAMGATPLFALNIVAFPTQRLSLDVLQTILEGAQSKATEAGIHILGGHTIEDNELKYGMVVNGKIHPDKILRNSEAKPGDALILTKPIGTGILATALKRRRLDKDCLQSLINSMMSLNRIPAEIISEFKVSAVTDVTGFGLLGHLLEMVRASQVSAKIYIDRVPLLQGVKESVKAGMIPGGSKQNLEFVNPYINWGVNISAEQKIILADAQTSGGLLISIPEAEAENYISRIRDAGISDAIIIGKITSLKEHFIHIH